MFRQSIKLLFVIVLILLASSPTSAQSYFQKGKHICGSRTIKEKVFFDALTKGDATLVQQLLQKGADPNATDDCNNPVISYTSPYAHFDILKLLISAGANVNAIEGFHHQPTLLRFIDTLERDDEDEDVYKAVQLLISSGADVNLRGESTTTALNLAVLKENERLVRLLISRGANINFKDGDEMTAYSHAARLGNQNLKKILIDGGADPNIGVKEYLKKYGNNAFIEAAADGRTDVVEAMLKSGTDVNKVNPGEMPALMRAAEESTFDVLLSHGADVNFKDSGGLTALHWAVLFRRKSQVEKLIIAGADVNAQTAEGKRALDLVTDSEIEAILIAAGAGRAH